MLAYKGIPGELNNYAQIPYNVPFSICDSLRGQTPIL